MARDAGVPTGGPPALVRATGRLLARRGVRVHAGRGVARLEAGRALLDSGEAVPFGLCVWATGAAAPPLLRESGAAVDGAGFLSVHDTLESVSHPGLFAAGDCAAFASGQRVPRAGVFAVREAPVLLANVRAALAGVPARAPFRAQAGALALLNAGDGTAVGAFGGLAFGGRWAWHLKDRIDRRYMRGLQRLAEGGR